MHAPRRYIPYTASALVKAGSKNPVDLRGIAIGNGFIDPKSQAGSELEMMVKAGVWSESSKVRHNEQAVFVVLGLIQLFLRSTKR